MTTPLYDLLLKGGRVLDPASNLDAVMDVAISGDRIAKVAADIPASAAAQVRDAKGLIVTPGLTIKDRLRVLKPNDPDNYYTNREIVPSDMVKDIQKAITVLTN